MRRISWYPHSPGYIRKVRAYDDCTNIDSRASHFRDAKMNIQCICIYVYHTCTIQCHFMWSGVEATNLNHYPIDFSEKEIKFDYLTTIHLIIFLHCWAYRWQSIISNAFVVSYLKIFFDHIRRWRRQIKQFLFI